MAREVDTKGYVKMYRKAQEDEVFKNPYAWQLFTYCLFNVTFDSRYGEVGSLITTKKDIANDLGLSRSALDKFMKFLKENKAIDKTFDFALFSYCGGNALIPRQFKQVKIIAL